jgi:phospholipase D3/4
MDDLRGTANVEYTEEVLVRLTASAKHRIDLTAMYWALLADPQSQDESGFSDDELAAMGATDGKALFDELRSAAERGVQIRILEAPGFSGTEQESARLAHDFPDAVEIRSITMGDWYGGAGIMHQKIWLFDDRDLYLGSANMDWKSIMQVKEMGVVVEGAPTLAEDVGRYFQAWWDFAGLAVDTARVFDPAVRIDRTVPRWSSLVPEAERAPSPFDAEVYRTSHNRRTPLQLELDSEDGGLFVTGCPAEVRGHGRTRDDVGLVHTIEDARRSICVSVMDFAPVGLYRRVAGESDELAPADAPVWWPQLFDALLSAVLTRRLYVRLLVSKWAHTSKLVEPFLRALQSAADAGRSDKVLSAGQLEIKAFVIPGWDQTSGPGRKYPGHTRVNHTKYIVTDRRINIGTSNMTWDYFTSTAGSSFNADHPTLVRTLQAVFDRDWASRYAYRL